jgi:hypothetical protein
MCPNNFFFDDYQHRLCHSLGQLGTVLDGFWRDCPKKSGTCINNDHNVVLTFVLAFLPQHLPTWRFASQLHANPALLNARKREFEDQCMHKAAASSLTMRAPT